MTKSEELGQVLFGKGYASDKIAENTLKMIVGDMRAVYQEYVKIEGKGALFYNTINADFSTFMTLEDIRGDKQTATDHNDANLHDFLEKLEECVMKEEPFEKAIIVLLTADGMSLRLLDLDQATERISDAAKPA